MLALQTSRKYRIHCKLSEKLLIKFLGLCLSSNGRLSSIKVRGTAVHTNIIYFYFAFPCLTADKIRVDESSYTGTSMRMHETED